MTPEVREIGSIVTRIQDAFLDAPSLNLTLSQAERRFGLDCTTCKAVLDTLLDAHVLVKTDDGSYMRFYPLIGKSAIRQAAAGDGQWQWVA